MTKPGDIAKLRIRNHRLALALKRLLWRSVADRAECTCAAADVCLECEAMKALGFERWEGPERAAEQLARMK